MSLDKKYRGYGIQIHTDDIDPLKTIGGITDYSVSDDISPNQEFTDGLIYPSRVSVRQIQESMRFTSVNPDSVIDIVGATGLCLKGDQATKIGLKAFLQEINECDTSPSTTGIEYQVALHATEATKSVGLITPNQLSCDHQGDARMSFDIFPKGGTGGTSAGIAVTKGVTLPAISDNKNRFGLSKLRISGTEYTGKKSMQIQFGVRVQPESADGALFPEFLSIDQVATQITWRGIDPEWLDATKIPRGGKSFVHADTEFFLAKYKTDGTQGYEPDGSAEHIAGTAAGKAFITQMAGGQSGSTTETVLVMWLEYDGINAPLTLNTGQQIT